MTSVKQYNIHTIIVMTHILWEFPISLCTAQCVNHVHYGGYVGLPTCVIIMCIILLNYNMMAGLFRGDEFCLMLVSMVVTHAV